MPVELHNWPEREVTGVIEAVEQGLVQLRMREDWTRVLPLVIVTHVGGVEVETHRRLERPAVTGVSRRRVLRREGDERWRYIEGSS